LITIYHLSTYSKIFSFYSPLDRAPQEPGLENNATMLFIMTWSTHVTVFTVRGTRHFGV